MSLFFLEAFEHVHKNRAAEYERMGTAIDNKVEETEPGMLIHVQTKISENAQEVVYRWVEVYEKYEDFQVHFNNPAVKEHIQKLTEKEILCSPIEAVVYCDWTDEQKEHWNQIPGVNLQFQPLINGYFR
jgi:quinol monooxygenase YgiN